MKVHELTLTETSHLIRDKKILPSQLLESLLQHIDKIEPKLHAWVAIDRENAIALSEKYSRETRAGKSRGPLHGVPVGIKDIFFTAGIRTKAGSKIPVDLMPGLDATVVTRLRQAGAIILGKTATTEFASTDPTSTRNPWNLQHTPGGSSSGSAVAVSTGMCSIALGSQTGGSTIRPAAYCGIVGLKPTYGRISRHGMFPLSWSQDHVGILGKTVADVALILEILAGFDVNDLTSASFPVPTYTKTLQHRRPPRLGLFREFFFDNASNEVRDNIQAVVEMLENNGAKIRLKKLPLDFQTYRAAQTVTMFAETAAQHAKTFSSRMKDYSPKIRAEIIAGLLLPTPSYLLAQRLRTRFVQEILMLLESSDAFLTPSTTTPAPRGLRSTGSSSFNSPWSFCGLPTITVPSGVTRSGLPMGIQLVGRPFDEETLINAAGWCEGVIRFSAKPAVL